MAAGEGGSEQQDGNWWNTSALWWLNPWSYAICRRAANYWTGYHDAIGRAKELGTLRKLRDPDRPLQAGDIVTWNGRSQPQAAARAESEIKQFGRDRISDGTYIVAGTAVSRINITQCGLAHVMNRHVPGGAQSAGSSLFSAGEDVAALIRQGKSVKAVRQMGGN